MLQHIIFHNNFGKSRGLHCLVRGVYYSLVKLLRVYRIRTCPFLNGRLQDLKPREVVHMISYPIYRPVEGFHRLSSARRDFFIFRDFQAS